MELYKELLLNYLEREPAQVSFPNLKINSSEIIELQCYQALQDIKAVIDDDSLNDEECFMKIEAIVNIFESIGSSGGSRHDFG